MKNDVDNVEYDIDRIDAGNFPLFGCAATVVIIFIFALISYYVR